MSTPVKFAQQNFVFRCGPIPNCDPLPCFRNFGDNEAPSVTSAWQLTPDQLAQVVASGGLVFVQTFGEVPPPVRIDGFFPYSDQVLADASKFIELNQVPVITMNDARQLDLRDRTNAREAQAAPLPTVDQAFGSDIIDAAITKLGRLFIDQVAIDQAGGDDATVRADSYPEAHVQRLGKAALAFFAIWPGLHNLAQIAAITGWGGDYEYAGREGFADLLDALSQYQNRPDEAEATDTKDTKDSDADTAPDSRQDRLALRDRSLTDTIDGAGRGDFERLKEIGTRVLSSAIINGQTESLGVRYNGTEKILGNWAKIEAHIRTAFDYYFPPASPGIVTYLTKQGDPEPKADRADRNVQPLSERTRTFLAAVWRRWLAGNPANLERFADQWNQTIDRALNNFLDLNSDFTVEQLANYCGAKSLGSLALLDGFPTLHEATQQYIAKYGPPRSDYDATRDPNSSHYDPQPRRGRPAGPGKSGGRDKPVQ